MKVIWNLICLIASLMFLCYGAWNHDVFTFLVGGFGSIYVGIARINEILQEILKEIKIKNNGKLEK